MEQQQEVVEVEINGVKMQVDMRYARRIEHLRVGSLVKVLVKEYSGHAVHPGVVVGFEPFQNLPTIVVAYVIINFSSSELKILHYNAQSKDCEIVAAVDDDLSVNKAQVLSWFDREQTKLERQMQELDEKRQYFLARFGRYWEKEEAGEVA